MRFRQLQIRWDEPLATDDVTLFALPLVPFAVPRMEWSPPTDLYESHGDLVVKAELPGLTEDAFDITLYRDMLVIRGERPLPASLHTARPLRAEIRYGPFLVAVHLPDSIARERVQARYDAGFLTVRLPKREEKK